MKDKFSLIAAAAGGFMLSVALTSILRGTPVTSLHAQTTVRPLSVNYVATVPKSPINY
ncbi:hypothetical protein [Calothrix sp. UHCC 0171]|uniref:hypothetical protein n=1 Tax=Calothrix sp. UHCC 0171 TaxID=3110245 RepID=UPI002B21ABD9|nr:hypothetical protein [Calothrix sp. UHCC 0171]MEA5572359.1 hypothetical protein [Calothrix sp. UHCC 0171]